MRDPLLTTLSSRVAGTVARDYNDTRRPALGVVGSAGYEGTTPICDALLTSQSSRVAGTAARNYYDTRRPALGVVGSAGYEEAHRHATPCSLLRVVGSPVRLRGTTTTRGTLPLG